MFRKEDDDNGKIDARDSQEGQNKLVTFVCLTHYFDGTKVAMLFLRLSSPAPAVGGVTADAPQITPIKKGGRNVKSVPQKEKTVVKAKVNNDGKGRCGKKELDGASGKVAR